MVLFGGKWAGKAGGAPIISYEKSIQQIDVNGNGFNQAGDVDDFYRVGLRVENITAGGDSVLDGCTRLELDADFATRGAYNFADQFSAWTYDQGAVGKDNWMAGENILEPGFANTVFYDVKAKDVIGWETVGARMYAPSGVSNEFGIDAPVVPEPATIGLLGAGALTALAYRRAKNSYRQK